MTGMSYYLYLCFLVSPAWMAGADVIYICVFLFPLPGWQGRMLFIFVFSCFPCLDGRGGSHFIYCFFTVFPPVRMTYYLYLCFLVSPAWMAGADVILFIVFLLFFPPCQDILFIFVFSCFPCLDGRDVCHNYFFLPEGTDRIHPHDRWGY